MADLNKIKILATVFCNGRGCDFQLFKNSRCSLFQETCLVADAGYQGLISLCSNSRTPVKKRKLHALTQEQKANNHTLSRKRVLIENIICRLKVFYILNERYRNRCKRFGLRFNLIAVICNLEL